jgi:hypothetical protein
MQIVQQDTAIMPVAQAVVSLGTLQAASAVALVQGAREMANALADVIERQKLATVIHGRKHVNVEGWTTLGIMLGVVPREVSTVETDGVYTATVELVRVVDQGVISRASAECGSADELDRYGKPIWANRPRYARRSMAQTRATGKACRLAFSWIMALAGYEPTPAEEMPDTRQDETVITEKPAEKLAANDRLITDNQRKLLEAKINEYQLNREGVKTWVFRRFDVKEFRALTRSQFEELLEKLPFFAKIKEKREAEQEAKAEREAIQAESKSEISEEIKERVRKLRENARQIRKTAQYANGGAYYAENKMADEMEAMADRLMQQAG